MLKNSPPTRQYPVAARNSKAFPVPPLTVSADIVETPQVRLKTQHEVKAIGNTVDEVFEDRGADKEAYPWVAEVLPPEWESP